MNTPKKPGWYVIAFRTRSLCRTWKVAELFRVPLFWGPYKRERFAKKVARGLRADRVLTCAGYGVEPTDNGPSFRGVKVFEVTQ